LTTEELTSEIRKLKEDCSGYRVRLQKIQSATNHIPPEEKEKVGRQHFSPLKPELGRKQKNNIL
jgi:hypothetical protein